MQKKKSYRETIHTMKSTQAVVFFLIFKQELNYQVKLDAWLYSTHTASEKDVTKHTRVAKSTTATRFTYTYRVTKSVHKRVTIGIL